MKFFKRLGFIAITVIICVILAFGLSILILRANKLLTDPDTGHFDFLRMIKWTVFWGVTFVMFANIILSHKFAKGKVQEILFFISSSVVISEFFAFVLYTLILCEFNFSIVDWMGALQRLIDLDILYFGIQFGVAILFGAFYATVIDRKILDFVGPTRLRGKGKLKRIENTNLENSRWMNEEEKRKLFKVHKYSQLASVKKDGIPVMGKLIGKARDMEVCFNSPCHSIIIGSTGSGKTTTFVSPMIQLLAATAAGSSMVITDPKGELFALHSKYLQSRNYDVKVVDLRDTYSSYRWNPLDSIWDSYEKYTNAHKEAYRRRDNVDQSGLKKMDPPEKFEGAECWYEFDKGAYASYDHIISAVKLYKKKIFDEVYEDLNDLVSVLIPIENEKDPMWEKGARSIVLATLLAMLEDSAIPEFNMTKEKYNFFNLAKILQNSSNDYEDLRNYFKGRSPLSKAFSLSKQVCDAATQTRASYMSIVYEKLTLFNDAGICALTSASDFTAEGLSERPTALFLKIPDEKDTRHNLAAIFILNIYKTLIKVASATEGLTLPRNVYFIMDEFGNMPKIEKFDKFITVGRSRKIWFNMIVQSYAQLNNVYGETIADIVKGNCGIKMFIGSNDMGTCKEYSELCGNITVVTTSTSGTATGETNFSTQTQVRPLIYPSELQRLNHPGDIGHSIIVTFGNYPFKTYFSPSFEVPFYKIGKMDQSDLAERFFDENAIFYDISIRNNAILNGVMPGEEQEEEEEEEEEEREETAEAAEETTETAEATAESGEPAYASDDGLQTADAGTETETTSPTTDAFLSSEEVVNDETQTVSESDSELLGMFHTWMEEHSDDSPDDFFASVASGISLENEETEDSDEEETDEEKREREDSDAWRIESESSETLASDETPEPPEELPEGEEEPEDAGIPGEFTVPELTGEDFAGYEENHEENSEEVNEEINEENNEPEESGDAGDGEEEKGGAEDE